MNPKYNLIAALGLLSALFAGLLSGGCTQNNGHIGDLFGAWALIDVTDQDGNIVVSTDDADFSTLRFQSDIAVFAHDTGGTVTGVSTCTWSRADGMLLFDFGHSDNDNAAGSGPYAPPAWLLFPDGQNIAATLRALDSAHLIFTIGKPSGESLTYNFQRTW